MSEEFDLLDKTIDAALDSYTPRAARPGLEQRILASVANARTTDRRRTAWCSWRPGLAVAATLLVAGLLPIALQQARPRPAAAHAPSGGDAMERTVAAASSASEAASAGHVTSVADRLHRYGAAETPSVVADRAAALLAPPLFEPIRNDAIEINPITIAPIRIAALN
jgi:hypothetical protein